MTQIIFPQQRHPLLPLPPPPASLIVRWLALAPAIAEHWLHALDQVSCTWCAAVRAGLHGEGDRLCLVPYALLGAHIGPQQILQCVVDLWRQDLLTVVEMATIGRCVRRQTHNHARLWRLTPSPPPEDPVCV